MKRDKEKDNSILKKNKKERNKSNKESKSFKNNVKNILIVIHIKIRLTSVRF